MTRRAGIRRWVRWGGVAAMVVIAGVWGASAFGFVGIYLDQSGGFCGIGSGVFAWSAGVPAPGPSSWQLMVNLFPKELWPKVYWLPRLASPQPGNLSYVPLWMPWIVIAGFTFWLFRADRLKAPHACPACGYDKTGLPAGAPCPECGAAAPALSTM